MNHVLKYESQILQFILNRVQILQKYTRMLGQYLEPELKKHCEILTLDRNCLIIAVDNPHWATQFRFQIPDLLSQLRTQPGFENLAGIVCKTRPPIYQKKSSKKSSRMSKLTSDTAENVQKCAENIRDQKLKIIMQKIALHID